MKTLASGDAAKRFVEVNSLYGMVRHSALVVDYAHSARPCGSHRTETSPHQRSLRIDPQVPNIVSERDEKKHSRLRSKLAGSVITLTT